MEPDYRLSSFPMTLQEFLLDHSITQKEFANRADIPQQTVSEILSGGGMRAVTALKIIQATGGLVTLTDLVEQVMSRAEG